MTESGKALAGLSVLIILLLESSIFPFMLSSAFTARTIVQEKQQQTEVRIDLWIAFALSVAASITGGILTGGKVGWHVTLAGIIFAIVLTALYCWRGNLSPW